jgi:hypothetical protein
MKQRMLCTTGLPVFCRLKVPHAQRGQNRCDWQETATPEELNVRYVKGAKPLFLPNADLNGALGE